MYYIFQKTITQNEIMQQFEKYGKIQSVDIRSKDSPTAERVPFAYVTFSDSLIAYRAVDEYPKTANGIFKVQPADTWHQPGAWQCKTETPAGGELKASLDILNDDCLLKFFDICDVESISNAFDVCQRFRQLIEGSLSKYRSFTLDVEKRNIQQIRKILRCIGSGVEKLHLNFHFNHKPANLHRILQKITQYVNGNIEELRIKNLLLTEDVLEQLKPLLVRIKVLKIDNYNEDFDYDVDLRQYCPDLIKLKVHQNMVFVLNSGPWKCLENVSIAGNQYMVADTFEIFCKNNPRLTRLNIQSDDSDGILMSISNHLRDLVKLTITNAYPTLTDTLLTGLKTLEYLKKLKLVALNEDDDFNGILKLISELKGLTHVKLNVCEESLEDTWAQNICTDPALLTSIAVNLTNLNVFLLENVEVPEDALVEFIQSAPRWRNWIFDIAMSK